MVRACNKGHVRMSIGWARGAGLNKQDNQFGRYKAWLLYYLETTEKGLSLGKEKYGKAAVSSDTLRIFSTTNIHIYTFW